MNFVKLEGAGNDFVLIDARMLDREWPALAKEMCRHHFGVGADGLLLLLSSDMADLKLRMFNPDGSEAEVCGNGLRCFARYAVENKLVKATDFTVETLAGIKAIRIKTDNNIQVSMGTPVFRADAIPIIVNHDYNDKPVIDYPLTVGDLKFTINCVSMGNPHAVLFLNDPVSDFPLPDIGPKVEHHYIFPNRVNFEVANIINRNQINARVWERGAGETLACGSGACAIAVMARLKKLINNPVDIILPGGVLSVNWDGACEVLLSGPAEIVFYGTWQ